MMTTTTTSATTSDSRHASSGATSGLWRRNAKSGNWAPKEGEEREKKVEEEEAEEKEGVEEEQEEEKEYEESKMEKKKEKEDEAKKEAKNEEASANSALKRLLDTLKEKCGRRRKSENQPTRGERKRRPRTSNGQRYPLPCSTHFFNTEI